MLNKKRTHSSHNDSGVILLELMVALVLTSMLALGITKVLGMSVAAIGYSQTNTITGSNTAGLDAAFSQDVAESNGFVVPFSGTVSGGSAVEMPDIAQLCTTWTPGDTTFSAVRPIITFSKQSSYTLTAASGDGVSATYTVNGQHRLKPLQSVTIAGVTPSSFNVTNATITSVPTASTFTVANTTVSSTVTNGAAAVNTYIGYDIRTSGASLGQIWRINCLLPGTTKTGADSVLLRSGLPISSSSPDWLSSIQCSTFSNTVVSNVACPINQFLDSYVLYPGITFEVPATIASTPAYAGQIVLGTRGLS